MRIANDNSDYTMIGTRDTNAVTNTQITMYGNTHPSSSSPNPIYAGRMEFMTSADGPFIFYSGGTTERMRITSTGNVGIGTNAIPSNSLPNIASTLFIGSQGYGICGEASAPEAGIYIGDGVVGARWKIAHGGYNLNLYQNNGSGTYNYRGAFANNTGAYSSVSDKRLKKLIEPIQYGLNDVLKFKPVSYLMENQNEDIDKRNLGFIAQDLEYIIPEIVNVPSSSNAVYSLQYTSIIPILIKAIQELNEIVTKNTNTSNMIV